MRFDVKILAATSRVLLPPLSSATNVDIGLGYRRAKGPKEARAPWVYMVQGLRGQGTSRDHMARGLSGQEAEGTIKEKKK